MLINFDQKSKQTKRKKELQHSKTFSSVRFFLLFFFFFGGGWFGGGEFLSLINPDIEKVNFE